MAGSEPLARIHLIRHRPDPIKGLSKFEFQVQTKVCGRYVGFLAKDTEGLGINVMLLKVADDQRTMRGLIVFNNIRTDEVEEGIIEWRRQEPEAEPLPDSQS